MWMKLETERCLPLHPDITSHYYIPLYLEWNLVILVESYVWWWNSQLLCPMVTHSHTLQQSKVLTQVQQKAVALKVVERTWTHQNYMVQWIGFHRKIETGSHRFSHYDQEAFRFNPVKTNPLGKASILVGFPIMNQPCWGTPIEC